MTPTVKELIKDRNVCFKHFQKGLLWYQVVGTSFVFPVPISDTGDSRFGVLDKAILFQRWIRQQVDALKAEA